MPNACSRSFLPAKNNRTKEYKKYIEILSRRHSQFKRLLQIVGPLEHKLPIWNSIEDAILYAVIGQMLSNKASASIISRLLSEFNSSAAVIKWAYRNSKKAGPLKGMSQRKRRALGEWLKYAKTDKANLKAWAAMPLSEYRREVSNIWGFGRWSADMIAIFYLARMDVWPETDKGIQKACRLVFNTHNQKSVKKYIQGCETIAAVYLWELLNRGLEQKFKPH
jgi:DNA-3-methyladenine glycosylase II